MNQVAVVIGGGQTLGAFLCHGLAAEGYRVAVVDIQSDKAANVAQEINAEYGEGTAYGFGADATSEQSVLALSRGVDEIFGRVDLLVYSAGIAKAAFISDFQLGDFDRSATKLGIKPDQVEQYYIDKVPLKRGCDYQDVLNMLLFYASPKASYCTGQSINVTGGQVMF
ncbi:MAG: SDR family oxidoreductase [Escherichia coli]|nr:SDR family oxidoreductase [Escherichia coli]